MYLHGDIFVLSISIATTLMQRIQIGQSRMSVLVPNDIMLIHWRSSFLQLKIIIRMTQGSLISSYHMLFLIEDWIFMEVHICLWKSSYWIKLGPENIHYTYTLNIYDIFWTDVYLWISCFHHGKLDRKTRKLV